MIQDAATTDEPSLIDARCCSLHVPCVTYYRVTGGHVDKPRRPRRQPRALTFVLQGAVLAKLHEPHFVDSAPPQVHTRLLDVATYLCSVCPRYRLLARDGEVHARRAQLRHPMDVAPELRAPGPNQVRSWDITKLKGLTTRSYYYRYVILDVFSWCIVGRMIPTKEHAASARQRIATTCANQKITEEQLTIHADRGSAMKPKCVAEMLADLGVTKTHSRPHVSNDNPYSKSNYKTLTYRPAFPARFGSLEDARAHCDDFVARSNHEHDHSGLA